MTGVESAGHTAGRSSTPCDACTGDGGRGHTLRGDCAGAPCPTCGDPRYQHVPGDHSPWADATDDASSQT